MILFSGHLTEDAQRRGDNGPLSINLKQSKMIHPRSGEPFGVGMYMRVAAWGSLRDEWDGKLSDGDEVLVQGELEWNSYEDSEGNKKGNNQINARSITRLAGGAELPGDGGAGWQSGVSASKSSDVPVDDDIPF
jgi:single-stranded DNA-binding protein